MTMLKASAYSGVLCIGLKYFWDKDQACTTEASNLVLLTASICDARCSPALCLCNEVLVHAKQARGIHTTGHDVLKNDRTLGKRGREKGTYLYCETVWSLVIRFCLSIIISRWGFRFLNDCWCLASVAPLLIWSPRLVFFLLSIRWMPPTALLLAIELRLAWTEYSNLEQVIRLHLRKTGDIVTGPALTYDRWNTWNTQFIMEDFYSCKDNCVHDLTLLLTVIYE